MSSAARVHLDLGPSPRFTALLVSLTGLTAAVPWTLGMPLGLALAASGLLSGWGSWLAWTHGLRRGPLAWTALELNSQGEGELRRRDGLRVPLAIGPSPWVSGWFVALALDAPARSAGSVVVWADSVPGEAFRRLRVLARWGARGPGKELSA